MRTDTQKATLLEWRGALLYQIEKWHELQAVYMPGVLNVSTSELGVSREKAESIKLWLPSQLDATERETFCLHGIISSERELRFGQLHNALDELWRARQVWCSLVTFHRIQLAGEGNKTEMKSCAIVRSVEERIE